MKKINITKCIGAAIVALMFVGCKPTEANYKKAYDAALAKREKVAQEQMRPATGLMSDYGPQLRVVDGDTIYVVNEMLRFEDGIKPSGRWAVAVGLFKMDTNAKASASDLRELGFPEAVMGRAQGDKYYTLAAFASTLDSIRVCSKQFEEKFPEYPYVGLPGKPVLIAF